MGCVSVFQSYHMFNFDCGFTHVSHIWPDRKFNGGSNGSYFKVIGATIFFIKALQHISTEGL